MNNLYKAHHEWATRGPDERFLDLESLRAATQGYKNISNELDQLPLNRLGAVNDNGKLKLAMPSGFQLDMTNWSFGQLCRMSGAPTEYMRKLPAPVVALNLNYGLRQLSDDIDVKMLYSRNGTNQARAFNGVNYGRIWDVDVVDALMNNIDSRWSVPLSVYNGVNSLEATTLYASDRDVFVFLTDETRPITVDDQTYFRGFYTWNSEVGSATFGIATFLFSYVCANRIIWGARDVEELRIRHTALAPIRFMEEVQPILKAMSEASDQPIIASIRKAQKERLAPTAEETVRSLVNNFGFTKKESQQALALAEQGGDSGASGDPLSIWNLINGGTASAREITHIDQRTASERQWSSLMTMVSGKPNTVNLVAA